MINIEEHRTSQIHFQEPDSRSLSGFLKGSKNQILSMLFVIAINMLYYYQDSEITPT